VRTKQKEEVIGCSTEEIDGGAIEITEEVIGRRGKEERARR
jgi:hypothetical protein